MRRLAALLILLLSVPFLSAPPLRAAPPKKSESKKAESKPAWPAQSTVQTRYTVSAGQHSTSQLGSGTVVAKDAEGFLVLTCRHVLGAGGTLTVITHRGAVYPAEVLFLSEEHDLSLLRVTAVRAAVVVSRLAVAGADLSDAPLAKSGYPGLARTAVIARGKCAGQNTHGPRGQESWVVNILAAPGDSGGGLFRESDHTLVGVVWGGKGGQLWAVPTPYARRLLEKGGVK